VKAREWEHCEMISCENGFDEKKGVKGSPEMMIQKIVGKEKRAGGTNVARQSKKRKVI